MYGIIIAALVAALVTSLVTPWVRTWVESKGAIDQPEERRINTTPMPRAGGIAIYLGFMVAAILAVGVRHINTGHHAWSQQVTGILVATTFIGIVSLIDDFKNLSPLKQTLGIVTSALILAAFGVRIEGITNPFGPGDTPLSHWFALDTTVSVLLTVIWVFTVTKTVDAIDGMDGLASGVCAICAATLALMATQLRSHDGPTLALLAAAVAGACLGFLRHNYHPAKIIMGTIGAWVLGLTLSAISILGAFKAAAAVSVVVPILVLGVPIFDYAHVLTRRFMDGAKLTAADKRHLHHRLKDLGWNDKQVVWFIYSVTGVLCITALALFFAGRGGH